MADGIKVDVSSVIAGLHKMADKTESLARSMLVAGGKVVRDEARLRAPVAEPGEYAANPGLLKSAIYIAYNTTDSHGGTYAYKVTWNHKVAPHGHLVEFGHWQPYAVHKRLDGRGYYTDTSEKLATPKRIPARPFLRPAWEATKDAAVERMMQRGRERLPQLLAEEAPSEPSE